ncbi:creatininase family protein [Flexithrix dorotheae]|uniref:creatininase family protein n=1 Tax=Flexithrix dorotheae TaxID=70993 RepID=UPI00035CB265|nr:creatininase family protein [Flexithrix dorotheae]
MTESKKVDKNSLVVFKHLKVGPLLIEKKRVKAPYEVLKKDGSIETNELIYAYEEDVFDPKKSESVNLASVIAAQVAINYGLFCEEIIFDGIYDDSDKRFISDMMENTSREIFVNKILMPNEFLKDDFRNIQPEKKNRYTAANLLFLDSDYKHLNLDWSFREKDENGFAILSSGGKDSLLSYGLMKEMGKNVHPVFVNESGRHWFTAINAYRHMKETESNTSRVWCNSDRIFNWMLRQMPFIKEDFNKMRADMYPIRLWTVAVFLFGVLPVSKKRGVRNILIGDEYDTTVKSNYQGITHYNSLYDQSKYFDNALTRYFMKKGWNMYQYSILRSLSELLILKILVKRYPELQKHQTSCHATHEKDGKIYPCGNCEKCRRIVGMLKSLDEDPQRCGYTPEQIEKCLKSLEHNKVKQIGPDAAQLYHLLLEKGLIAQNEHTKKLAKQHEEILNLRFDNERSLISDLPSGIREEMFKIYLEYADGSVVLQNRKWNKIDLLNSPIIKQPYPFELKLEPNTNNGQAKKDNGHLWEKLTWEELDEKLKVSDTAILPCGAIEQHGPHLPVDIDYYDANYLARKVAEACSEPKPLVIPPIPFGVSYHHEDFKGTISVSNDALSKFVYDIGMSLAQNGIKKLIIINGHGDNAPTLNYAAQMINRDAHIFVCVDTGETSDEDLYHLIDTPNDIHAGEIETSTTLALRPEMVKMDKAVNETLKFGSTYLDFTSERSVSWYVRTKKISESGIMGDPTKATAEKGKKMWDIMIAHLVKFVEEIKSSKLEDLYQKRY